MSFWKRNATMTVHRRNHHLSVIVSIIVHGLILAIHIPDHQPVLENTYPQYDIPVSLRMVDPAPKPKPVLKKPKKKPQPIPPTPPPSPPKPTATPTPIPTKKSSPIIATSANIRPSSDILPTKNTVTSLPGDREAPELGRPLSPIYPKQALNDDLSGKVTVDFLIDSFGKVSSYTIIESSGYALLDQSFIQSVMSHPILPKRSMGDDQEGRIRLSHAYEL